MSLLRRSIVAMWCVPASIPVMNHSRRARPRSGIVILWVVIGVTLAALLAIGALPLALEAHRQQAATRTAEMLWQVKLAILDSTTNARSFRPRVSRHPSRLSQLVYPISTSQQAACGTNFQNPHVTSWNAWGPFIGIHIDSTIGLVTPIGTAQNLLIRQPANVAIGVLVIRFPVVDEADAIRLDEFVDGADGSAAGTVRWAAPAGGTTALDYRIYADNIC